jgi:hypothetical protein
VTEPALFAHAAQRALEHPGSTAICWLDAPETLVGLAQLEDLKRVEKNRSFVLSKRRALLIDERVDICHQRRPSSE